jgi:hypothetical protein
VNLKIEWDLGGSIEGAKDYAELGSGYKLDYRSTDRTMVLVRKWREK